MAERQFGPYRLVQQLAVGGMAEIHLAKTSGIAGFEKYVVLKMIHPNFSQDHHFIQMLIDEAKITVQLQHVNIAQTFDLGRVGDTFYITMEYVDGADLYKLMRKTAELDRLIPIGVAAFIVKEVASGLDYAHRKRDHAGSPLGIVHRDVSPQNILISYAGEVKLVDFGIAKATMRARQTAAGVIKGKYYYMSPEQAWGEPLDHRTDIFSAGILLYESLTGQMLYLEDDLHKLLDRVRRAHIPPPSTLRAEIPAPLDRIVMRALAKRLEDRYQSAADLANDLEHFLHTHAIVFTANKVAAWIAEILGQAAAPTLLGLGQKTEQERDRGDRETRRITRDQLVLTRSEFTDENSVIFALGPRESPGTGNSGGTDEHRTVEAPVLEEEDADPLPDRSRDPEPTGRHLAAAPAATHRVVPVTVSLPAPAVLLSPPHVAPARRADATADENRSTRQPARADNPRGRPPAPAAGPRAPDQETRLVSEQPRPSPPPPVPHLPEWPARREEPASGGPDDATLLPEAPSWWSAPGEPTEVSRPPSFNDRSPPSPPASGDVDLEAPTLLKKLPGEVARRPGEIAQGPGENLPTGLWEPAPALAASVPRPAISQLRPPRDSRRTPAGGVAAGPAPPPRRPGQGAPDPRDGPPGSVLASLLSPNPSRAVPAVVLSPPTPLSGAPTRRPAPGFPWSGRPAHGFSTRAMTAALERDEIPEKYKIRRRIQPTPWLVALFALALSASVVAILLAIYGPGGNEGRGGDAVLKILSLPPGATVTVDGQVLSERTPTAIKVAPGERYLFGFELPRYQREEQEFVVPEQGGEHQVVASLDPMVVKLTIESRPSGAEVFIGGNSVGRTPIQLPGLDPQSTTSVELRLKGHRPVRQAIDWSRQTEQRLVIPLIP